MKTSDSIEAQEERKTARNNRNDLHSLRENTQPVTQKRKRGDASYTARIAPFRWQPGYCPNPGGRPKHDLSAEIARAVFENNADALYAAFSKALLKGNAYCYKELSDRAYGKLKEHVEYEVSEFRGTSDEDLQKRITELERDLGLVHQIDEGD
jgi:hypothetical protein